MDSTDADVIVAPGDGEVVRTFVDGVAVAVWNVGGELYAVGDVCPHRGWVLSEGPLERGADGRIRLVCPGHHWRFALDDGQCDFAAERIPVFRLESVGAPSGDGDTKKVRVVAVDDAIGDGVG